MMSAEACLGEQGPDPKVLISYLAFLCARLLDVSKEERAAFRLQQIWKRRRTLLPGRPPQRQEHINDQSERLIPSKSADALTMSILQRHSWL